MVTPGTEESRQLRLVIPHLDDQRFALFAYALCTRLQPLSVVFFGNAELHRQVRDILERAAAGESELQAEAEELRERLEQLVDRLNDSDDTDYPLEAVNLLAASLQRLAPRDFDAPDHVYLAAQAAASATGLDTMDADLAEEARAQLQLLHIVQRLNPEDPAAIDAATLDAPWVTRFERLRGGY